MKKKSLFFVTVILLVSMLVLAACGSSSDDNAAENFPDKPVTLIVPWSAGGGTDTGARLLQPYLEDELGVSVTVVNKTGAGGWIGWNDLANADPDGYTIGLANSPHIITGYINPTLNRDKDLDDFIGLGMHVVDPDTVSIRPDEDRFTNLDELIEYAQNNEVTVTSTGEGTDEHLVILNLNKEMGTNFVPVHFDGAAESRSSVLGGHVDVLVANLGEILSLYHDGDIEVLGVAAQERSSFMEDVPTLAEQGVEVYQESSRGFLAPAGTDPEVVQILEEALEKAINNEEHIEKMTELGFGVRYETGEDYMSILKDDEQVVIDLKELLGWE